MGEAEGDFIQKIVKCTIGWLAREEAAMLLKQSRLSRQADMIRHVFSNRH
jgi:hypothetical protein